MNLGNDEKRITWETSLKHADALWHLGENINGPEEDGRRSSDITNSLYIL